MRLALLALLFAAACFDPHYDNPTCGPAGACPDGLTCGSDNVCRAASSIDATPIDANVPDSGPDAMPVCGDGHQDNGEACDDGNVVTEAACPYGMATCTLCNADCSAPLNLTGNVCGDANTDPAHESCDDGNTVTETACAYGTASCTACNATCTAVVNLTGNICGDGNRDAANETCDDGNVSNEVACPYGMASCQLCNATCTTVENLTGNVCGDGNRDAMHETCDDGNTANESTCPYGTPSCTGCNSTCSAVENLTGPFCGDGIRQTTDAEACDDGNTVNESSCPYGTPSCSGCNSNCSAIESLTGPFCGDGLVNSANGESCDDGNSNACGVCSATCSSSTLPTFATGNIGVVAGNQITDGSTITLNDGINPPTIFEMDKGGGVTPGHIPVFVGGLSTGGVAQAIVQAVNNQNAGGTLFIIGQPNGPNAQLTDQFATSFGNQPVMTTELNFFANGMSGGTDGNCPVGTGCTTNSDCTPPHVCTASGGNPGVCQ